MGLNEKLRRSLSSTNLIESCFARTAAWTWRVKRWRHAKMVLRWGATALLVAETVFRRIQGHEHKVTIRNLRFWLFVTAAVLSHPAGKTTVKLAVPTRERAWWRRLWEKNLSPFPNCNAVENRPAFSG